jgi:hypothetical protein
MEEIARDNRDIGLERDDAGNRLLERGGNIVLTLVESVLGDLVVPTVPKVNVRQVAHS